MGSLEERIRHALLQLDQEAFQSFKRSLRDPESVAGLKPLTLENSADVEEVLVQIALNYKLVDRFTLGKLALDNSKEYIIKKITYYNNNNNKDEIDDGMSNMFP